MLRSGRSHHVGQRLVNQSRQAAALPLRVILAASLLLAVILDLNLQHNNLSDAGVGAVAEALIQQVPSAVA